MSILKKNLEKVILGLVSFARKEFKGTFIQRLTITSWVYRRLFSTIQRTQVIFRGYSFEVKPGDITINPSLVLGDFEKAELDLMLNVLRPGDTVLDVGANIGIFSVIASKHVGAKGKVFAVEAVPENIDILNRNLVGNSCENVNVLALAAGDCDSTLPMFLSEGNSGTHSFGLKTGAKIEVQVKTLDSILLGQKIDFIKMDIEGYEPFAIRGLKKTLQSNTLKLLIEINSQMLRLNGEDPLAFITELFRNFRRGYIIDKHGLKLVASPETVVEALPSFGSHANLYFES